MSKSDTETVAVFYVGPHEFVEVPVGDESFTFQRDAATEVPADVAKQLRGNPALFTTDAKAASSSKEK